MISHLCGGWKSKTKVLIWFSNVTLFLVCRRCFSPCDLTREWQGMCGERKKEMDRRGQGREEERERKREGERRREEEGERVKYTERERERERE
jgi:hypothetical protein